MNSVIYIGLAINVIGALLLLAFALKYHFATKEAERMPARMEELKTGWRKKRRIAFGFLQVGLIIAFIGCLL